MIRPAETRRSARASLTGLVVIMIVALAGCAVGPHYVPPKPTVPPAYKEQATSVAPTGNRNLPDQWWQLFTDPQLDALEEQIRVSNQNLKQSEAQYRQARAIIRFNRANYYPTVTAGASITPTHDSDNKPPKTSLSGKTFTDLLLTGDLTYEVDAWGRVRHTVEAARENAEASAADLAAVNLSLQSELAVDYFELRSSDAQKKLLDSTVQSYEKALELTQNRYTGGLASSVDVEQARTQLETTRAQDIDVGVARAQFEHAIAALVGKPPSTLNLTFSPATEPPPDVPAGIPSQLLERRPDIAADERRVASANAAIGVAATAYFPSITLSAAGGLESGSITTLVQGPSALWSASAGALVTAFDVGRRRALTEEARASYDSTVASYRQTVLTAFQQVEDNLAALRILEKEASTQAAAVAAARRSLTLSENRYKGGVAGYLEVLTAQSAALGNERTAVDLLRRRMDASVLLIKALGGGWDAATGIPRAASMANDAAQSTAN